MQHFFVPNSAHLKALTIPPGNRSQSSSMIHRQSEVIFQILRVSIEQTDEFECFEKASPSRAS